MHERPVHERLWWGWRGEKEEEPGPSRPSDTRTLLPFSPTTLNLTQDVNRRSILISEMLTHKETWLTELMNRDTIPQL